MAEQRPRLGATDKSPQPHGSGLFHFWMRDIVLASIHFRDRRKIMIAKTTQGKELVATVFTNLQGHRLESVELSFIDLQKLMKEPDHVVLEFLRSLYGRMA